MPAMCGVPGGCIGPSCSTWIAEAITLARRRFRRCYGQLRPGLTLTHPLRWRSWQRTNHEREPADTSRSTPARPSTNSDDKHDTRAAQVDAFQLVVDEVNGTPSLASIHGGKRFGIGKGTDRAPRASSNASYAVVSPLNGCPSPAMNPYSSHP